MGFFLKQQLIHLQKQEVHKVWKRRNEDQRGVFVNYPKSKQPETFSVLHGGRMSWDKAPGTHECSIYIPSHLKSWATGQRWTLTAHRELTFNHELRQMGVCLGPFCLSTLHNLQSDKQECFADMRQRHRNYVVARLCDGISRTVLISNILFCCLSKWYLNTFFFHADCIIWPPLSHMQDSIRSPRPRGNEKVWERGRLECTHTPGWWTEFK